MRPAITIIPDFTLLSCHVRVSEWIHTHNCLNVKELLARSRRHIWSLSDCNVIRTYNHLVPKQTLNNLAKWLSARLWTKWLWVQIKLLSLLFLLRKKQWIVNSVKFFIPKTPNCSHPYRTICLFLPNCKRLLYITLYGSKVSQICTSLKTQNIFNSWNR